MAGDSVRLKPGLLAALAGNPVLVEELKLAGDKIAEQARELVPVQTGRLRDSIRVELDAEHGKIRANVMAGNRQAWYALLIEFGTEFAPAYSFLRGAAEALGYKVHDER